MFDFGFEWRRDLPRFVALAAAGWFGLRATVWALYVVACVVEGMVA